MPGIFGRRVTLAFGQAGAAGLALADLRVAFQVRMSQGRNAHSATIRAWNISPISLAVLAGPLPTVQLSVGYGDPQIPGGGVGIKRSIFLGEIVKDGLKTSKEGVDRITEIEAQDTPGAYQLGAVSLTFPSAVSMSAVVSAVAAQLLLPVGFISVVPDVVLSQGGVFVGAARDVLDRIADSTGCNWWISDGLFYFVPSGSPVPLVAPLFSSLAGNLIGSPIQRDRGGVEVKALLDASVRPGSSFIVQSTSINGTYVVTDVEFVGDSGFDTPFYVRVLGKPLGA